MQCLNWIWHCKNVFRGVCLFTGVGYLWSHVLSEGVGYLFRKGRVSRHRVSVVQCPFWGVGYPGGRISQELRVSEGGVSRGRVSGGGVGYPRRRVSGGWYTLPSLSASHCHGRYASY